MADESRRQVFGDGSFVEVAITRVPRSDRFPDGVKYRFQYVAADGTPLLRYDNAHGTDERHEGEDLGEPVAFAGSAEAHLSQFLDEVDQIRETE